MRVVGTLDGFRVREISLSEAERLEKFLDFNEDMRDFRDNEERWTDYQPNPNYFLE